MAWSGLANNQAISDTNLNDAVSTGVFTAGTVTPIPTTGLEVTKSRASGYITVPNPYYPPYATKPDNQLVVKGDVYNSTLGTFTLNMAYAKTFKNMTGTGLPSFSFPLSTPPFSVSNTFVNKIVAQNISVVTTGSGSTSNLYLALLIDSALINRYAINQTGDTTTTVNIPYDVYAPSTITLSIQQGVTPPAISFSNIPITSVAISRTTGQYQIASAGIHDVGSSYQQGYLYVSTDYGATWTQRSIPQYWSKVAVSHDGTYMLAVARGGGAYISSNNGSTFTQITSLPAPSGTSINNQNFKGCAISGNGQYQVITTGLTTFPNGFNYGIVYTSSDYGVTWTARNVNGSWIGDNTCAAISSNGQVLLVGYAYFGANYIYKSTDYGVTWSGVAGGYAEIIQDISVTASGTYAIAARFLDPLSSTTYQRLLYSTNSGASFSDVTGGSPDSRWYGAAAYYFNSAPYGYAVSKETNASTLYVRNVTSSLTNVQDNTASGQRKYRCIACSDNGNYVLAGVNTGLIRSADGGVTWSSL